MLFLCAKWWIYCALTAKCENEELQPLNFLLEMSCYRGEGGTHHYQSKEGENVASFKFPLSVMCSKPKAKVQCNNGSHVKSFFVFYVFYEQSL